MKTKQFDVIVIGAGGAGLRAALELKKAAKSVAVVSKVFPTRSHTVSAQGGIAAAIGNVDADSWQQHMFDTIKGSDYLGDQDCIEFMCKHGPEAVYELEHMGLPFSRLADGKIYQRAFGGQSKKRTLAAADRTGHALLQTLYQQNLQAETIFFSEWYAIDLVKAVNGNISGVIILNIATGALLFIHAKIIILATGGAGQIYQTTSNALINTGDGIGLILRAGLPVQDMEMWQFHPTGLYGKGILITEGARGEGGHLLNKNQERFMQRYAPTSLELASRDVVSRAITMEIMSGRGCGDKQDYIELKIDHLGLDIIKQRLPGIFELAKTFANVDPSKQSIPIVPTCHYMMGGIPTNKNSNVITIDPKQNSQLNVINNLYAIGECACVSVHGANRLGGNSLLELIVFGKAASHNIIDKLNKGLDFNHTTQDLIAAGADRLHKLQTKKTGTSCWSIKNDIKNTMQHHFGVFRDGAHMQVGLSKLKTIQEQAQYLALSDYSKTFNTELIEALEIDNILKTALATAKSAIIRTESRGAHVREDFPARNDENWLKHILIFADNTVSYRPVNLHPETSASINPTVRLY